ncbi:OmpW family outer membrane protein [Aquabacterium sp.]|uniref:OmpW/AlkL family protein n=1 Tax=Aquabacterium sp. TaxID=1872578 RepID=UPI0024881754|nr:OmpW family outer membrane protein [Aquabacterium sp.]MDI1349950.1 outer membrane beta-barrel protein [Aquabacterium sp.]
MKFVFTRVAAAALGAWGALSATSASAQYTVKLGGAYFDTNATSTPLRGQLPAVNGSTYLGNINLANGPSLEVQNKGTVTLSIERALDDHWGVELILGAPPKHEVKLRTGSPQLSPTAGLTQAVGSATANAATGLTAQKLNRNDGVVVATVRQWAPTFFVNYRFFEASARLRPFVGVGLNVTRFKSSTNEAGDKVYNDGNPYIRLSDSYGPAVQAGVSYKLDAHWSLNASVLTARVDNKLVIETAHSRQEASFRFTPTVWSASVGYSF